MEKTVLFQKNNPTETKKKFQKENNASYSFKNCKNIYAK